MKELGLIILFVFFSGLLNSQTIVTIDGIPRDTSFTVHSAFIKEQKKRPYIKIVKPEFPENVKVYEHVVYSSPEEGRNLHANIYRANDNKTYPALLMVHGGGWSSGDLTLQVPMAQQIAARGYVTIPVEYRLSPEAIYPAAVHDLKTAVRWVRTHASEYGIDTTKIAISGCSSGGHLAMLAGITNFQPGYEDLKEYSAYPSNVHAIINVDGISDFLTDELDAVKVALSQNKTPSAVRWLGGTYEENKEVWLTASPVNHVTHYSAPVCFINSSLPRFHAGRDEIIEKLKQYNIYTKVHTIEDTPHPFWLFHPWFNTTITYMTSFLDKMFK